MLRVAVFLTLGLLHAAVAACGIVGPDGEELVLYVGPERVECTGVGPRTCLLVRYDPADEWERFSADIEGFDFEPDYEYMLLVRRERVEDPPADGSSLRWILIEILEKTAIP